MSDQEGIQIDDIIHNCEIHGDYNQRSIECLGRVIVFDKCQQCTNEEKIVEGEKAKVEEEFQANQQRVSLSKQSGVSARYRHLTLNDINPLDAQQERTLKAMTDLAQAILDKKPTHSIIITGGIGTGKTMMCSALIGSIIGNRKANIIKCIDMVRKLKSTWSRDSAETEESVINYFTSTDLLIIDEVGIQFGSDTEKMFIFDIIDGRYENLLPTVIVSNLGLDSIKDLIGERVIDRLRQDGGKLLTLESKSNRK